MVLAGDVGEKCPHPRLRAGSNHPGDDHLCATLGDAAGPKESPPDATRRTISFPGSDVATHVGGSIHVAGTTSAGRSGSLTVTSNEETRLPDVSSTS